MRPCAHVTDAEHQLVLPVAAADDGVLTEHESLTPAFWARDFYEDQPGNKNVDESTDKDLQDGDDQTNPTFRVDDSRAVPDSGLSLERIHEGRREVGHLVDARDPVCVVLVDHITVDLNNSQVDTGKHKPAGDVRGEEQDDVVSPTHLDDCGE